MITVANIQGEMNRLKVATARYVRDLKMNCRTVVKEQAGLLQKSLVTTAPPKNKQRLIKTINRDVSKVFAEKPKHTKKGSQLVWLYSGPKFVIGVEPGMFRKRESDDGMRSIYRTNRGKTGKRFTNLGYRGKQAVMKINRFIASGPVIKRLKKFRQSMVGGLKASFAVAWHYGMCAPKGSVPRWIAKIIESRKVKGTFINGLNESNPTFTIVSNAPGCNSQKTLQVVREALIRRNFAIKKHIQVLLKLKEAGKWTPPNE